MNPPNVVINNYNEMHILNGAIWLLHSTETALLRVHNDLRTDLDSRKGVIPCLLDLSTAFDTIDHDTFFQRLSARMGIHSKFLDWFKSYLMDRCHCVWVVRSLHRDILPLVSHMDLSLIPMASHFTQILFLNLLNNTMSLYTCMQIRLSSTFPFVLTEIEQTEM